MPELDDELFKFLNANQLIGNKPAPIFGAPGMSSSELEEIEVKLGFDLPSDFRHLFRNVQDPGGVLFPWSHFSTELYDNTVARVWSGIEFDIQHNTVWLNRWGARPSDLDAAKSIAREDFKTWPKLLPISGHRFLPAAPSEPNNPVFSIVQTDIIYYGSNLADYLVREFCPGAHFLRELEIKRRIDVWSDFAEQTDDFTTL